MGHDDVRELLAFWLGGGDSRASKWARDRWFTNGRHQEEVDRAIFNRWGERVLAVGQILRYRHEGSPTSDSATMMWVKRWRQSPEGSLALVVLLDQFSRHVERYRRRLVERSNNKIIPRWCRGAKQVNLDACSRAARTEVELAWKGVSECVENDSIRIGVTTGDMDRTAVARKCAPTTSEVEVARLYYLSSPLSECLPSSHDRSPAFFDPNRLTAAELTFLLMPFRHGIGAAIGAKTTR